jgi:hypothetical protein
MYSNITLRRVRVTIIHVEKQSLLNVNVYSCLSYQPEFKALPPYYIFILACSAVQYLFTLSYK